MKRKLMFFMTFLFLGIGLVTAQTSRVLDYTNGNKTEAAKLLKIGLTTLYRKIEE